MNIVIYARFSSDLQNDKSAKDQIALCRAYITKNYPNAYIAKEFSDEAISGTSDNRKGMKSLINFISDKKNSVDKVIVEDIDRLSRRISSMGLFYETCEFYDIKIQSVNEGEINELHVGLKGTMNALQIKTIKQKTWRGSSARAMEGRIVGNRYGYVVAPKIDERGRVQRGYRAIVPHEAEIIKKIFTDYANGLSLYSICQKLNGDNIPNPRGGLWKINNLFVNYVRREGILCCELYNGIYIYNRTHRKVNPITGKSHHKIKPLDVWNIINVEHLRIIEKDLWERVQHRIFQKPDRIPKEKNEKVAPRLTESTRPLTHLIYCTECGAHATIANLSRYVCSTARVTKACKNYRGKKESDFFELIYEHINFCHSNHKAIFNDIASYFHDIDNNIMKMKQDLSNLQIQMDNLMEAITSGLEKSDTTINKINKLSFLHKRLHAKIENEKLLHVYCPNNFIEFQQLYIKTIQKIHLEYDNSLHHEPINSMIKCLIEKITMTPDHQKHFGVHVNIIPKEKPNYIDFYLTAKKIA